MKTVKVDVLKAVRFLFQVLINKSVYVACALFNKFEYDPTWLLHLDNCVSRGS